MIYAVPVISPPTPALEKDPDSIYSFIKGIASLSVKILSVASSKQIASHCPTELILPIEP